MLLLAEAAAGSDGVGPLSEQVRLQVGYGGDPAARNLLLWQGTELAGYAYLGPADPGAGRSGELVIHPCYRRRGLGLALTRAVLAEGGPAPVRVWAHGDLPAAARLASATGFTKTRVLWQMRRPLRGALDEPRLAAGVRLRTFIQGKDEAEWLELNARAFAGHPEQGRWTRPDLERREREPWFDPGGFFLAEHGGRMAGFHWTKVHKPRGAAAGGPGGEAAGRPGGSAAVGEVYVIGVDPAEQASGLGRALTLVGLRHLRDRGIGEVMLYVEAANAAAIRLYSSLGFVHAGTDVMYQHGAGQPDAR